MKKSIFFSAIALLGVIFFAACKKDGSTMARTSLQRLQAKWTFNKEIYHRVISGTPEIWDTTQADIGDYMDFRTDGKVYIQIFGNVDTGTYSMIGDTKIVSNSITNPLPVNDTVDITLLTDNALQLYTKSWFIPPDYSETTDIFSK